MQKKISVELSPELHAQVKAALYGGIGAVNAYIDENGHLIIELKTGQTFDCGMAVGPKGDTGPQGERGPQGEKGEKGDTGPQGAPGIISELQDEDGTAMPPEPILQFVGFQVNDDPSGKTIVSPKTAGGTQNVAGYVGEISLFADNQLRENHVWADGSTINPATWPDLAAYAATAGWETDSGTGWYKTPNLQGCFLLPSSAEYAVNTTGGEEKHTLTVDEMPAHKHTYTPRVTLSNDVGWGIPTSFADGSNLSVDKSIPSDTEATGSGQPHNNMPPYYVVTAQIRAKVDIIEATAVEVNGNTLGGFEDGEYLVQQNGKITGAALTPETIGAVNASQIIINNKLLDEESVTLKSGIVSSIQITPSTTNGLKIFEIEVISKDITRLTTESFYATAGPHVLSTPFCQNQWTRCRLVFCSSAKTPFEFSITAYLANTAWQTTALVTVFETVIPI